MAEEKTENLDGRAIDVTITSTTFAKVANYFVAIQVNKGKKVRTEVSAGTEKPKFKKGQHVLDLGQELQPGTKASLTLGAFVVLPAKDGGKGNARLLGSVTYDVSEASVRLLRGETVSEDLSLIRKTGDREVVVGKISVSISLVGVGDAVDMRNVDPSTRVIDIIVHGASKLKRRSVDGVPTTWVEARVLTPMQAESIKKYEKAASDPMSGDVSSKIRKEIEGSLPERKAETRSQKSTDPTWNEIMTVAVPDKDIADGAVLRLDVSDLESKNKFSSIGGVSIPIPYIEAGHQYDLEIEMEEVDGLASTLGVSISARDSPQKEEAALQANSNVRKMEILLKSCDGPFGFGQIDQMVASVRLLTKKGLADMEEQLKDAMLEGPPTIPIGTMPLNDGPGSGPNIDLFKNNMEDPSELRTLEKLTPSINPLKGPARFDYALRFDMGDSKGIEDYPEAEKPAALFITYYRRNLAPYAGDGRGLRGVIPNYFMGYSLIEMPSTHPEDGTAMPWEDVPIMLMPPGGNNAGQATDGPKMKIITKMWSGKLFLDYMKDGDPLATTASSGSAMKWMKASARLYKPKELTGIAKAMSDARQGGALTEEENKLTARKEEEEEKKSDAAGDEKEEKKKKKKKKEDEMKDEMKDGEDPNTSTSLRSDSKMVPTMPGQPNLGMTLGTTGSTIAASGTGMNAASLMLRSEANQKEVDELHKRLSVLTEDIAHKQTLIDRLLKEVDKRSDAIRTCGVEIVQLRRTNKKLTGDKEEMEKQMKAMVEAERREAAAISQATEDELSNGGKLDSRELAQRLHVMQEKFKTERDRNTVIMQKLKTLYQQSAKVRHSQQHFAKLEKAHQAQAAFIQKLQTENQKIEVYKSTIRTQERVVAKLEEVGFVLFFIISCRCPLWVGNETTRLTVFLFFIFVSLSLSLSHSLSAAD